MSIIDKFRQISKDIKENMLLNSMKLNENDLDSEKAEKMKKRFNYYKDKKDFVEMDKTLELWEKSVTFPDSMQFYKRELVYLAAKEDKQIAYDYMSKYKLEFNKHHLDYIMKDNNLPVLELFMINPDVKLDGKYQDLFSSEVIAKKACFHEKIDFLHFACNFPNQDTQFYSEAIKNALISDFPEGIKFIATHYKDKLPQEVFTDLTKTAINFGRLHMAEYLKEMSNDNSFNLPNGPIEQKIKQLREENFGKNNTNNVLKK